MPAVSKAQQRLMAQAYQVRKYMDTAGEDGIDPKSINSAYRDQVVTLAKQMKGKDLKKFAETSHDDLPDHVGENNAMATTASAIMSAARAPII